MKNYFLLLFILLIGQSCASNESIFELSPAQSMSITGLEIGQDAANNPYVNGSSLGKIKNIGKSSFTIRIQNDGVIIESIDINPKETKEVILLKGHELYLDSASKGKAQVLFEKYTQ